VCVCGVVLECGLMYRFNAIILVEKKMLREKRVRDGEYIIVVLS
jgi:hypothetical protein